jgi:hypothetical protein
MRMAMILDNQLCGDLRVTGSLSSQWERFGGTILLREDNPIFSLQVTMTNLAKGVDNVAGFDSAAVVLEGQELWASCPQDPNVKPVFPPPPPEEEFKV